MMAPDLGTTLSEDKLMLNCNDKIIRLLGKAGSKMATTQSWKGKLHDDYNKELHKSSGST